MLLNKFVLCDTFFLLDVGNVIVIFLFLTLWAGLNSELCLPIVDELDVMFGLAGTVPLWDLNT
jgi:hypothetical protein